MSCIQGILQRAWKKIKEVSPDNYNSSEYDCAGTTYSYDTVNKLINSTFSLE